MTEMTFWAQDVNVISVMSSNTTGAFRMYAAKYDACEVFVPYTLSAADVIRLNRTLMHELRPLWTQDRQQSRARKRARRAKRAAFRRRKQGRA